MLDIRFIRENPEAIEEALKNRHAKWDYDEFRRLDEERREIIQKVESLKAERNAVSKQIGQMMKEGNAGEAEDAKVRMRAVGDEIEQLDAELAEVEEKLEALTYSIPNIPGANTPVGDDENDNPEVRRWGTPREFDFEAKAHWDLGPELGIIDFERGVKLAHARFYALHGAGARLERALINFMLNTHIEWGSVEWWLPALANKDTLTGTGQLPKFEDDLFKTTEGLYLIPTAEVMLTNLHANEVLDDAELPIRYCAYTPCFREEAGSAGRDTRGIIRVHQFDKVEMFVYAKQEDSYKEHEHLLAMEQEMLGKVEVPYRIIDTAAGDLGSSAARKFDCEAWVPTQGRYRELTSTSNCTEYQARRLNIRERMEDGNTRAVSTLNGTLATTRWLVAILENHQQKDGSIEIPKAMRPYMGGKEVIEPTKWEA